MPPALGTAGDSGLAAGAVAFEPGAVAEPETLLALVPLRLPRLFKFKLRLEVALAKLTLFAALTWGLGVALGWIGREAEQAERPSRPNRPNRPRNWAVVRFMEKENLGKLIGFFNLSSDFSVL